MEDSIWQTLSETNRAWNSLKRGKAKKAKEEDNG